MQTTREGRPRLDGRRRGALTDSKWITAECGSGQHDYFPVVHDYLATRLGPPNGIHACEFTL